MALIARTVPPRVAHRTQDQRSAETRQRLIESTIDCLCRYGYAAATTGLIADFAGVTRGAVQHQFGTRIELMLAVTDAIQTERQRQLDETTDQIPDGPERFVGITDASWEVTKKPLSVAYLEILMACRSEPELQAGFTVLSSEHWAMQRDKIWDLAQAAGITDQAGVEAMTLLHRATLYGLSLFNLVWEDDRVLQPAIDLLRWYKQLVSVRLMARPGDEEGAIAAFLKDNPLSVSEPFTPATREPAVALELIPSPPADSRGAKTRALLIDAAVNCLARYGYAATTTPMVAEMCGFSRGALQQQFPTRTDLMLAVIQATVEERDAFYAGERARVPAGKERFVAITDMTWATSSSPSGIALSELMLASRNDEVLRARCQPLFMHIIAREGSTWRVAQEAGITDKDAIAAMRIVHRAALRGLAIFQAVTPEPQAITQAVDLLRWYKTIFTEHLIAGAKR